MNLFRLMSVQIGAINNSPGTYQVGINIPPQSVIRDLAYDNGIISAIVECPMGHSDVEHKNLFLVLYEADAHWSHDITSSLLGDENASAKFLLAGRYVLPSSQLKTEVSGSQILLKIDANAQHKPGTFNYLLYEVVFLNPTVSNDLDL